jgi:hypothetical protein
VPQTCCGAVPPPMADTKSIMKEGASSASRSSR